MKRPKTVGIQYAALPYRLAGRRLEILLITSRETRRWVIPKGWPMDGLRPHDAAAAEATEEAGVVGEVEARPIGSYRYLKRLKGKRTVPTQVIVFPLKVDGRSEAWKEQGERSRVWTPYARASALVAEPSLKRLIREFGRERQPGIATSPKRVANWMAGLLTGLGRIRA